jgi:hypothetical protein
MTIFSVYDSVADFIATLNPEKVLELKATPEMQQRLEKLVEQEKSSSLSKEEKDELDHYIVLERLIRLAKARALYILAQ